MRVAVAVVAAVAAAADLAAAACARVAAPASAASAVGRRIRSLAVPEGRSPVCQAGQAAPSDRAGPAGEAVGAEATTPDMAWAWLRAPPRLAPAGRMATTAIPTTTIAATTPL